MKKVIATTMLFLLFLLSTLATPAFSQTITIGVEVGDWFLYEGTLVLYEADPGTPFPPNEYATVTQTYNESNWQNYTVTAIDGNNVTFEVVTDWINGSATTELNEDITEGFAMQVIPAGLEEGAELRPEYDWTEVFGFSWIWPARLLNESMMWTYEGETRETNTLNWTHPAFMTGSTDYTTQSYWWDKDTGVLVRYRVDSLSSMQNYVHYVCVNQLVETNLWDIPEFPTGTIMLLTFVAVAVSIDIYRRKKLKF